MSVEILDENIETAAVVYESFKIYVDDTSVVDARRRLEDRLEENRLLREIKDFDFDD